MKIRYMAALEVDGLTHRNFIKEGKITVGWNLRPVFENINVTMLWV